MHIETTKRGDMHLHDVLIGQLDTSTCVTYTSPWSRRETSSLLAVSKNNSKASCKILAGQNHGLALTCYV